MAAAHTQVKTIHGANRFKYQLYKKYNETKFFNSINALSEYHHYSVVFCFWYK